MTVELHAMTCGWLTMAHCLFLEGEQGELEVPIPSYLIKHPKGVVLFDSGLEEGLSSPSESVVKATLGPLAPFVRTRFKQGEDVAGRLEVLEVDPERIDYLINSHLHMDHCGGNALIRNARLVVQRQEWACACTPEFQAGGAYVQRHFDLGHDRIEVEGEYDLFGDGSVVCIPTPGHTPGHQSLRVKLEGGDVVLTSDACYMRESLEQMRLPDPMVVGDREQSLQTLRTLRQLQQSGAHLLFGHDPRQWHKLTAGVSGPLTLADVAVVCT
jgi:N-acyl homoserine lactone hydrolase